MIIGIDTTPIVGDRGGIRSIGYFVCTVGITEEIIRRYLARQGKEDAGQAQLEF